MRRALRITTAGAALAGVTALLSGAALALSQVRPTDLMGVETFSTVFTAHGAMALTLMPLLLVRGPLRSPHRGAWAACIGLALLAPAMAYVHVALHAFTTASAAGGLGACALLQRERRRSARMVRAAALGWLALVFVWPAVTWMVELHSGAAPAGVIPSWQGSWLWTTPIAIALGAVTADACEYAEAPQPLVVWSLVSAVLSASIAFGGAVSASFAWVAVLALAFVGWRAMAQAEPWPRRILRARFLLVALGATGFGFLYSLSDDHFLRDTLFAVATVHALLFVAALGWLSDDPPSNPRAHGAAVVVLLVGATLFLGAEALLGAQGNPRRYASYLDRMGWVALHRAAAVGALMVCVGAVVAATQKRHGRVRNMGG